MIQPQLLQQLIKSDAVHYIKVKMAKLYRKL